MKRTSVLAALAITTGVMAQERGDLALTYIIASDPNVTTVNLSINTQDQSRQNATAPLLYGLMHEDINHSGDGGIYAELLPNRAFQGSPFSASENPIEPYGPSLTSWYPIGNVTLALDRLHPLSDALPNSMMVTFPANITGDVGFLNTGWWGMDVTPQTYNASFYINAVNSTYTSNTTTTITVDIRSNTTGAVWASESNSSIHIDTFMYTKLDFQLVNTATAPDGNNSFAVTFKGEEVAGQTFYFSLFSLFPETFKNRRNGLRKDIAEAFYDIKPGFLRFPGGNNIEGQSIQQRWKWYETIGPLENRPGRVGDWGYYNTDGLGLMEYFDWCEDMDMEPQLAVYAGYSLDGTSYPESAMDQVLEEVMNELEFCLGDNSTTWGSKRVEYGHPEPYNLNYVEIGNEDFFSCTYPYRFKYLYTALKEEYPNIRFISTQFNENSGPCPTTIGLPAGSGWDAHNYQTPSFYLDTFDEWDNWKSTNNLSDVEILLGEYSVFQLDTSSGYVNFSEGLDTPLHPGLPQMLSAIGEGVYQLAAERNPDVVTLSTYAPSLQNRNSYVWTPNLVVFQAQHNLTVLSTSYWQQWLFGNFRGTHNIPVDGQINPLYWVGNIDNSTGAVYLKIINTGNQTVSLTIDLDSTFSSVNGTILQSDDPNAYNDVDIQTAVVPRAIKSSDLPTSRRSTKSTTSATDDTPMTSTISTASGDPGVSSVSSSSTAVSMSSQMMRRDTGSSTNSRPSNSGAQTWTWTVPVFSSTVLQFNPS